MDEFKNILIIKPSAMGDIVMALPALHALRQAYPNAKISWLVRPEFASLLKDHPELDEIVIFDRKKMGKWFISPASFGVFRSFLAGLRNAKYDLVVDLQGLFRSGFFAWVTGAKMRVGLAKSRELAHLFYTKTVAWQPSLVHVVDYYLHLAEVVTGKTCQAKFVLPQKPDALQSAMAKLEQAGVNKSNYCVLIPASSHTRKNWPAANFSALADKISSKFGFDIILVGSAGEKPITGQVLGGAKCKVFDLAGQTNIPELVEILRNARLVVSNDTGPGQLAASLDPAVVLIFGPSNPIRLYPYGRPDAVAANNPYGRGYAIHTLDPIYRIDRITVEQVFAKICEVVK